MRQVLGKTVTENWVIEAPSTGWNYLGLFKDYGLDHIVSRNKTFLFLKIENLNFQHLNEEFRETSQNFNSIRQSIEKMKIAIV